MKMAKINPFSKRGDRNKTENCGTINFLTSVGKLFEKLLYKHIVRFFQKKKCFHQCSLVLDLSFQARIRFQP